YESKQSNLKASRLSLLLKFFSFNCFGRFLHADSVHLQLLFHDLRRRISGTGFPRDFAVAEQILSYLILYLKT
ncbi:hypothetical protein SDJN02_06361, partial [Cucurbita argyrosperma subsp. argyrosperma]